MNLSFTCSVALVLMLWQPYTPVPTATLVLIIIIPPTRRLLVFAVSVVSQRPAMVEAGFYRAALPLPVPPSTCGSDESDPLPHTHQPTAPVCNVYESGRLAVSV